jgi:hypothetical protein
VVVEEYEQLMHATPKQTVNSTHAIEIHKTDSKDRLPGPNQMIEL